MKIFLVVVAALVALALFVQPACGCVSKAPARYSTMLADLRNLERAQNEFHYDSARFARSIDELTARQFQTSTNVALTLVPLNDSTWKATITHSELPDVRCEVANVNAVSSIAVKAGEPGCDPPFKDRRWRFRTF